VKVVLDTNVLVSGAFFSGLPHEILLACKAGGFQLLLSPEILAEYHRAGSDFLQTRSDVDFEDFLGILLGNAVMVEATSLDLPVCRDPDDDKFLACAIAGGAKIVVSGDKALRDTSGYAGISVLTPREFAERYLNKKA
jgi:putative PIN family toxin of toxin-antitoxin system